LGWGGWWFWDPVENASFMPWLMGTALIHSLAVTERRGLFKSWTLLLAISTFSLSLLGTFLVRSGIIVSVHAFATDPTRGFFILAFLAVVVIGALALYAWRAPALDSTAGFNAASRETFLLLNNVLLVVATTLVLLGTLAPLIVEMLNGGKISIGPPWFEVAFLIPMIPLVFLMGFGMHTAWRKQNEGVWFKVLKIPAIAAIVIGVVLPLLFYGRVSLMLVVGCTAAVWVVATALVQPYRSWRRKDGAAGITRSALGMSIAHLGMGLFVLGATIVSAFGIESDRAMRIGETLEVADLQFQLRELREVQGPNYTAIEAVVEVRDGAEFIATVRPQKRQYLVQKNWMTEAGIHPTWNKDLFIALGDQLGDGSWSVRIQYKPMIRFLWIGAFVMALGGMVSVSDRRYRKSKK
jgi:cytochrome c-type biogenesis protein CcmF